MPGFNYANKCKGCGTETKSGEDYCSDSCKKQHMRRTWTKLQREALRKYQEAI